MGKVIPKRKQWSAEQTRGPKRVKVEVKSTQTEETQCSTDGMSNEAYELMVKGRDSQSMHYILQTCRIYPKNYFILRLN